MYAGYLRDWGEEVTQYFQTLDRVHFHDIEGTPIDSDILERWALWLNSPWSYRHENYHIEMNLSMKDNYTRQSFRSSHTYEHFHDKFVTESGETVHSFGWYGADY